MKTRNALLITVGLMLAAGSALAQDAATPTAAPTAAPARGARPPRPTNWWSQAAGENGPTRVVWAAHKVVETPYTGPNKPVTHIADILAAHKGQARWDQPVLLTRGSPGISARSGPFGVSR